MARLKELCNKPELFSKGHRACAGCTGANILRQIMLTAGPDTVVGGATGCMEVVTTIFLDRAIGLFSIIVIATTCILLNWDAEKFGSLVGILVLIFAALFIGAIFVFSARLRHAIRLPQLAETLPGSQQRSRHRFSGIGRCHLTINVNGHRLTPANCLFKSH